LAALPAPCGRNDRAEPPIVEQLFQANRAIGRAYYAQLMYFELVGEVTQVETFATGSSIREIARLRRLYGRGRWRKRKGIARVRLPDGKLRQAEVHWYEAHGIGRKEFKIKYYID
jgi:hypothetical protein